MKFLNWLRTPGLLSLAGLMLTVSTSARAQRPGRAKEAKWQSYLARFAEQQQRVSGTRAAYKVRWFVANVPYLEVPDKSMEEMYYFRWFSFQKHLQETPDGCVITEFLPEVSWAGKYNTIPAAAEFHLREARWLRDSRCADEYARFWSSSGATPRLYSFAYARSVLDLVSVTNNRDLLTTLLPAFVQNYDAISRDHQDANHLFWQTDDRDGMEFSGGGSGYRPTINSYMYGEATAIAAIAKYLDAALSSLFQSRADQIRKASEAILWNSAQQFYETVDRDTGASAGVRELIGYLPWYYGIAETHNDAAWRFLFTERFWGSYGPTTVERGSSIFMRPALHETLWNGPSWPFATTQALTALANYLDQPGPHVVDAAQYRRLFMAYVAGQHMKISSGELVPWIDEDLDADTGEWIARNRLALTQSPDRRRGEYYNHSGFADLMFTGLFGLRPSTSNTLEIRPLVDSKWSYFCVLGLRYHGHVLDLIFDQTGSRYGIGKGFVVRRDGKVVARRSVPAPLKLTWPES